MSRALTHKQAIELSEVWHQLARGDVFLVTNGREFLVEGPDERQDRGDGEEAVLRIWTHHEDAWVYCESQQEYYDVDSDVMHVIGFTVPDIFDLKRAIEVNAAKDFGAPVRADVCVLKDGEPVVLDTLWSAFINPN